MIAKRMHGLEAYIPGEQPRDKKYIKLNTNENPYGPSPRVTEFLKEYNPEELRLYPDPLFFELRQLIAQQEKLKPEQVFIGNGSDEVLSFCFYAFFDNRQGPLLFPTPSYSFYPVYSDFYNIQADKIDLDPHWQIDLNDFLNRPSSGVIFPNPNAPTGCFVSIKQIDSFLQKYDPNLAVIIDEAYIDFGAISAASLIKSYSNLIIVRTLSKGLSLAGLRLGYALGSEKAVEALFTVKDSFNSYPVDSIAQNIACIALSDKKYYQNINTKIISERKNLTRNLASLGWEVLPSKANFIFARKPSIAGQEIYTKLKDKGILVRWFNKPRIMDFIRISIGKPDENQALLTCIKEFNS